MKKILSFAALFFVALTAFAQDVVIDKNYKALSYIESTEAARENAFTTDYIPVTASQISIGFRAYESGGWQAIFCARNTYAGTGISLYKNGNNVNFGYFTGGTTGSGDNFAPFAFNTDYDVVADVTNLKITANGETTDYPTGNTETNATTRNLSLFANPEWDNPFRGRISYAKITEGEDVKRDYVPVMKNDGTWGYYDKVTKTLVQPAQGKYDGYNYAALEGKTYIPAQPKYSVKVGETVTIEPVVIGPVPNITYRKSGDAATIEGNVVTGVEAGVITVFITAKDEDNVSWRVPVTVEVIDISKSSFTVGEYIEHLGGRRQNAITTDYVPSTPTKVTIGFQQTGNNGWAGIFCARNIYAGTGISLYANGDNTHLGYFTGGTTGSADNFLDYENGKRYDIEANTAYLKYSVEGGEWETKETGNDTMNPTSRKLSVFANPEWDNSFIGKIFYFNIDDEEQHYAFVPAMRHDGQIGFLDQASGKFFAPAEGNFDDYAFGKKEGENYVEVSKKSLVMMNKTTETLTVTGAEGGVWASDNEEVATVEDGVVTAVGIGTCTLTFSVDTWKITVPVEVISNVVEVEAKAISEWDGEADAIVPAIRYAGDDAKWAYTIDYNSGHGMGWSPTDPNYNVIVGVPSNDEAGKPWYAADYEMNNTTEASWTYNNTTLPSGWSDNTGDVYVRRYFKTVAGATLPENVYMPAPHDDAPCEYYINGELVWARTGWEPGVNGWYEDEVVRLTDAQKALIKTDGSVNVFAYHVHQNWGGRYADGGLYVGGSPKVMFEGNANSKRLQMAVAQAKTIENFDAKVLEYAENATVCLQDVNYALNLVRFELKKALAPRFEYEAASAEPEDGLEVYIYNVGTGQFLAGNNEWGTHTSVKPAISSWPMILHANTSGENRYSIQTNLPNGTRGNNDWLGHNGYVDCGGVDLNAEGWAWTFEPVGDGTYHIINSQNSGENIYLGVTEDYRYQVDTDKAGADNPYNLWKLITPEQFFYLADAGSWKHPANMTYKIHQNSFSQNDFEGDEKDNVNLQDGNDEAWANSKWERNAGSVWNWKGNDADGDYVFEMWNARNEENGKVYIKQTVEGLKPGKYVVSCNGFYRDGNWDSAVGGNDAQLAYLYAGTEENKVALKSILDAQGMGAGYGNLNNEVVIPDNCRDAAKFFQYGQYVNEVEVLVGEEGTLEFGVYREDAEAKEGDWVVLDNFTLTYYGVGEEPHFVSIDPEDGAVIEDKDQVWTVTFDNPVLIDPTYSGIAIGFGGTAPTKFETEDNKVWKVSINDTPEAWDEMYGEDCGLDFETVVELAGKQLTFAMFVTDMVGNELPGNYPEDYGEGLYIFNYHYGEPAPLVVCPEDGAELEAIDYLEVTCEDGIYLMGEDDVVIKKDGEIVVSFSAMEWEAVVDDPYDVWATPTGYTLNFDAITEPGTYTVEIPAATFIYGDSYLENEAITLTYTIIVSSIDGVTAGENAKTYNVAGVRVNGSAKGLIIKNGKKVLVK